MGQTTTLPAHRNKHTWWHTVLAFVWVHAGHHGIAYCCNASCCVVAHKKTPQIAKKIWYTYVMDILFLTPKNANLYPTRCRVQRGARHMTTSKGTRTVKRAPVLNSNLLPARNTYRIVSYRCVIGPDKYVDTPFLPLPVAQIHNTQPTREAFLLILGGHSVHHHAPPVRSPEPAS